MLNTQGKDAYWTPPDQGLNDKTLYARATVSQCLYPKDEGYVIFLGGKLQAMGPGRHECLS